MRPPAVVGLAGGSSVVVMRLLAAAVIIMLSTSLVFVCEASPAAAAADDEADGGGHPHHPHHQHHHHGGHRLAADAACANFCSGKAGGLYPNPCDATCTSYFNCANGITSKQTCASGLMFNPTISVCDWPSNVVCKVVPPSSSPSPSPKFNVSPLPPPESNKSPPLPPPSKLRKRPSPPPKLKKMPSPPPPKNSPSPPPPKNSPSPPPPKKSPSPPPPPPKPRISSPPPPSTGTGCPSGWSPAVGTLYDSWPKPGTTECVDYSGCRWAGMFHSVDGGSSPPCRNGAQWLDGGDGVYDCRFPEAAVRGWSMAATYQLDNSLLDKKLQIMVQGKPGVTVAVNVKDVCSDSDCDSCCRTNTGNKRWKLIDIEKWPASTLLGFDPTRRDFDINNVDVPSAVGLRPGAPETSVMPLCYTVLGPADQ